ncbi:MAG: VCBS repeat-containing protein [Saprospiraceae bacterium]|nr:VCBS repeat-containing protein [Saprospiraceae bacterium]
MTSSISRGIFCAVVLLLLLACTSQDSVELQWPLPEFIYERVGSDSSGLDFINSISENLSTKENLLDFDYFYNGAGVGIGDINNDGLPDVFMSANQVPSRLYLNKGNLRFEDITEQAGINAGKQWSNGVTYADVNADGWLDIYVSQGGPVDRDQRANLLYINQGDLTFSEEASKYGLADLGISTQSAFFDYDKDGDLDCFVMNESELYGFDPIRFYRQILENPGRYEVSFSHLYQNDGGVYRDVSRQAGISAPTFGLGLVISDINSDGWLDVYVANDYFLPDNLYINQKNNTFLDRSKVHLKQLSFYGMGADVADINNDGFQDIMVLDMASKDHIRSKTLMASMDLASFDLLVNQFQFPHQYMFNSVQLNDRNGQFNNIAHMSGLAKTDWSWAVLAEDLDLDRDKDLLVTNGYRRYALDNDFKARVNEAREVYGNQVPLDTKQELYNSMPSETLANMVFRNDGNLSFREIAREWGIVETSYSNGAAVADLDGDGDLDLLINNIDQEAFLYRNLTVDRAQSNYLKVRVISQSGNRASFAKVTIKYGDEIQFAELNRVRGYMSSMPAEVSFGLGDLDEVESLSVEFLDGGVAELRDVKANQVIVVREDESREQAQHAAVSNRSILRPFAPLALGISYRHSENNYNDFSKEVLLPQKQSTMGPNLTQGDLNGDGRNDMYIGGAAGQPGEVYLRTSNGTFVKQICSSCLTDQDYEDMGAVLFDLEGDGDNDLYVVSGGNSEPSGTKSYEDRLYLNDGSGQFARVELTNIPNDFSGSKVRAFDFDKDGDDDLLVCNRIIPQRYPQAAPSLLLVNEDGTLIDRTKELVPQLKEVGIVNDAVITDLNGDGWQDFVAVGEWTGIHMFENSGGAFENVSVSNGLDQLRGWWFSIHETDINKDGKADYLAGNVGTNIKHKATVKDPFRIYLNDFDSNGTMDLVLSTKYQDEYVPVRGKECSTEQMPFISQKFPQYIEFASASLVDIYGEKALSDSYFGEASEFSSVLLINKGEGHFEVRKLPREAQAFPLLDAVMIDINNDGLEDAIVAGCLYETEVETPRLDAGSGMVLLSDGRGYQLGDCPTHCFHISGNVKQMDILANLSGRKMLVATRNNSELSLFELRRQPVQ